MGALWLGHFPPPPPHLPTISGLHILSWFLLAMGIEASFQQFCGLREASLVRMPFASLQDDLWDSGLALGGL